MSQLTIKFSDVNPQTNEKENFEQSFEASVDNNVINYVDENNTSHKIQILENELMISSVGTFEVSNHYKENSKTKLLLKNPENNESFSLDIKTISLVMKEDEEVIDIALIYNIFEKSELVSEHDITIKVVK